MTQILVIIQVALLTLGLLLLLYYARFQSKLLKEVVHGRKVRLPLLLKIYAFLLFLWFGFLLVELVRALF